MNPLENYKSRTLAKLQSGQLDLEKEIAHVRNSFKLSNCPTSKEFLKEVIMWLCSLEPYFFVHKGMKIGLN